MKVIHFFGTCLILLLLFTQTTLAQDKIVDKEQSLTSPSKEDAISVDQPLKTAKFPWPAFMPAITGSNFTEWGAYNAVCCSTGWTSFNLSTEGTTKHAVQSSCSSGSPTWEGWQESREGAKTFSWSLTSDGCGSMGGSFSYFLDRNKGYLFYPSWTGSAVQLNVAIFSAEREADNIQWKGISDLQPETVNEVLAIPFENESGVDGSWQQCSQP